MNTFVCDNDDDDDDNRNEDFVVVVVIAVTVVVVVVFIIEFVVVVATNAQPLLHERLRVVVGHALCFNFVLTYVRTYLDNYL